jgi:hypothetical protein
MSRNIPGQPNPGELGSDWISRVTVPDLYPRQSDPFKPAGANPPPNLPPDLAGNPEIAAFYAELTSPGTRPPVFQRALNYNITAGVAPIPLINQDTPCDAIIVDVFSTAANSVFFGFGSGINVTSGIEVQAGNPLILSPENVREQWDLQKPLEFIAALMAKQFNLPALGTYRAPRVVLNANDYFVVAAAPTAVSVMLFYVPEQQ